MGLSEAQIVRYSRHILLPDVGGVGQERLLGAEVAVQLGPERAAEACALCFLAAAGVGRLVLTGEPHGPVTSLEAELGIPYAAADVGRPRIEAVSERLGALNPDVEVTAEGADLTPELELEPAQEGESAADALLRGARAAARFAGKVARR